MLTREYLELVNMLPYVSKGDIADVTHLRVMRWGVPVPVGLLRWFHYVRPGFLQEGRRSVKSQKEMGGQK